MIDHPDPDFMKAVEELKAYLQGKKEGDWADTIGGLVILATPASCDPRMGALHGMPGEMHEDSTDLLFAMLHVYFMSLLGMGAHPSHIASALAFAVAMDRGGTQSAVVEGGPLSTLN